MDPTRTEPGLRAVLPSRPAAAGDLEIRLFGPMDVRIGLCPLPRLRSRRGLWLLALLAMRAGRPLDRDWLAGLLWPDSDAAQARRSLRQSLHDLRRALGPAGRWLADDSRRTLRLEAEGAWVDVLAFDTALARPDLDSQEAAVRLYRGPFLEGCVEEWCLPERRQREEGYLAALERLAGAATAHCDHTAAARFLRQAVEADPYQEELQRSLMEALAASGNRAEALSVYRRFCALLARDVGMEPAAESTALFLRLQAAGGEWRDPSAPRLEQGGKSRPASTGSSRWPDHPAGPVPPPAASFGRGLPVPLTRLIGRDEAVQRVMAALAQARLVTLTGTGGIGKTRLALEVAGALEGEYEHGAVFVDLAPLADPATLPEALQAALEVCPSDAGQETLAALRQYLAPRRMLLLLDNCEHLLPACAALAGALLGSCPGLRVLATSRQPLGLRGETVWRVPSLSLPAVVDGSWLMGDGTTESTAAAPATINSTRVAGTQPSAINHSEAVQLFVERARAAEASFEITPQNAPAIAQLCRRLDGIPLAIELAAARVRSLSVHEIAARLQEGFGLLAEQGPALLPRQRTMAAALDWSWDLLSPAEQTLLQRLSVFAGGWTLEAAEVVCSDFAEVVDLLTALVDKSLVLYLPARAENSVPAGKSGDRYRLLVPVRQYAMERLREGEEFEAVQRRHCDYFIQWVESVNPKLRSPEQALWFRCLEIEHDNLRAALAWCCARGEGEKELRLVTSLARFWDTCGHLREGRVRLEAALSRMTPDRPSPLRCWALGAAGWMAYVQHDYPAARAFYGQALLILREHDAPADAANALNMLALVAREEGDVPGALSLFEESLARCRELGHSARLGAVLQNLGSLLLQQGEYEMARTYLTESVSWCEAAGDRQLHGLALLDLSVAGCRQGRSEEARARGAAGLRLLHDCGAVVDVPQALDQMATLAGARGEWNRAARLWGAAARLREAVGLPGDPATEHAGECAGAPGGLSADAFAAAFAEGQAMDVEAACAYALAG
jgi:predicted ATPase/DNA-binding SARP family transcriptional activator